MWAVCAHQNSPSQSSLPHIKSDASTIKKKLGVVIKLCITRMLPFRARTVSQEESIFSF